MVARVPGYEIVGRIGKGGMGEIWEAVRVGPAGFRKSVAIKQLPLESSIDGKAVQRFLQEARISAQLEHPNIVRIHDLLVLDGHFIVMELLRGRDTGEVVKHTGAEDVPWWLAAEIGEQALAGLEYAHALRDEDGRPRGLVHRDLTPRNLFLTESGVVKILDFGIAKLRNALTPGLTEAGHFIGTLGFLPPEQARADDADARSDLFQIGAMMYWALTGVPPNGTGTPGEILARAAHGTVKPIAELRAGVPAALAAVIMRALEREPAARPQSAAEMRGALRAVLKDAPESGPAVVARFVAALPPLPRSEAPEEVSATHLRTPAARADTRGDGPEAIAPPQAPAAAPAVPRSRADARPPWLLVLAAVVAGAAFALGRTTTPRPVPAPAPPPAAQRALPRYDRVTFRRGTVQLARFADGGRSFVYSARWGEAPSQVFLGRPEFPEVRALDLQGAELAAVSPKGELAVLFDTEIFYAVSRRGTLAIASLAGGAPREVMELVQWAEWTPQGELMVVRWQGNTTTLELPPGNVLWKSDVRAIASPRISPDGSRIAFQDYAARYEVRGRVAVVDRNGRYEDLTGEINTLNGLAWNGDEVWYSGSSSVTMELRAVRPGGRSRVVMRAPIHLVIDDIAPDGRVLLRAEHSELAVSAGTESGLERDASWFDFTYGLDVAAGGKVVLIGDSGDALGTDYGVYLSPPNGPAVRIGDGLPAGLSHDGRWAATLPVDQRSITLVPTGPGEPRTIPLGEVRGTVGAASWFPDDRRLLLSVLSESSGVQPWVLDLESERLAPVERTGLDLVRGGNPIAPNGREIAMRNASTQLIERIDVATGRARPIAGTLAGESVLRWSPDGRSLYVAKFGEVPLAVFRVDLASGKRRKWRDMKPADPTGVVEVVRAVMSPSADAYAYTYLRLLSTLYIAHDL